MSVSREIDGHTLLYGVIVAFAGLTLLWFGTHGAWEGRGSLDWEAVEAVVVASTVRASRVRSESGYREKLELEFRYSYQVGGRVFESERISFKRRIVPSDDVRAFVRRHPVGRTVIAYHHPSQPERAVLEQGAPTLNPVWLAIAAVIALLGFVLAWAGATGRTSHWFESLLGYH